MMKDTSKNGLYWAPGGALTGGGQSPPGRTPSCYIYIAAVTEMNLLKLYPFLFFQK